MRFIITALFCGAFCFSSAVAQVSPHDADIYGVKLGMDVSTALETIFRNSGRPAGKEKPDALRREGKDIRVLYKDLPSGNVQIIFADGKWVKEIILEYAKQPHMDDLHLPPSGSITGVADTDVLDSHRTLGKQYDDRYSVGYTSDRKMERYWWRDEKTPAGFRVRIGFVSGKISVAGAIGAKEIARKIISVPPEDESNFAEAMAAR